MCFFIAALLVSTFVMFHGSYRYSLNEQAWLAADRAGRPGDAIENIQNLIAMSPDGEKWQWETRLGQAYLSRQEWAKALEVYEKIHAARPAQDLNRPLMVAYFETGNGQQGQVFMQRVLKVNSRDPSAAYYMGRIMFEGGKYLEAARQFRLASADPRWDKRAAPMREKIREAVLGPLDDDAPTSAAAASAGATP
jgi:tetratricopeptide (TPR) repeat protein